MGSCHLTEIERERERKTERKTEREREKERERGKCSVCLTGSDCSLLRRRASNSVKRKGPRKFVCQVASPVGSEVALIGISEISDAFPTRWWSHDARVVYEPQPLESWFWRATHSPAAQRHPKSRLALSQEQMRLQTDPLIMKGQLRINRTFQKASSAKACTESGSSKSKRWTCLGEPAPGDCTTHTARPTLVRSFSFRKTASVFFLSRQPRSKVTEGCPEGNTSENCHACLSRETVRWVGIQHYDLRRHGHAGQQPRR